MSEQSSDDDNLLNKISQNHAPSLLNYLQSCDKMQLLTEIESLPSESVEHLWDLMFDSTDIDHLRNLLDLLTCYAPELASPLVIRTFPFDILLELESHDVDRTSWIINTYLKLYEQYRNFDPPLVLPTDSNFYSVVIAHVRNLPPSEQICYLDYATVEVVESTRCMSEKIARGVVFPSRCKEYKVRCIVLGIAGVGKSTLINVAHDEYLFAEAVGGSTLTTTFSDASKTYERPRHFNEDVNSLPDTLPVQVTFTDSPGPTQIVNSSNQEEAVNAFQSFLQWTESDIENHPNVVLYCINSSSNRISDYQYFWLISLARFFPVVLVMTSSFSSENKNSWKRDHFTRDYFIKIGIVDCVFVNLREVKESGYTIPTFGLDQLPSVICDTFNKNISKYIENQEFRRATCIHNNETRSKLHTYCRAIWSAGVISSVTAGSIPAAWVNDAATVAVISSMLSAMTTAYGLIGILGMKDIWDLLKTALVRVGLLQATAVGSLLIVDQLANLLMGIPLVGSIIGSGISGTCSGIAAFFCGKIWWSALEKYRLEYNPGTEDPKDFLINSIEIASHKAWKEKFEMIKEMNDMIRNQQTFIEPTSDVCH